MSDRLKPEWLAEGLYVVDGRHRRNGAEMAGVEKLRVDVHHAGGYGMYRVPIGALKIDPDVQFEDTYRPALAKRIAREWDPEKAGVLLAVTKDVPPSRKAELKMARDGQRRNVGTVERFRARVLEGEREAMEIDTIVKRHGWSIANGGRARDGRGLSGVGVIERIYGQTGGDGLERVLALADRWQGDPGAGNSAWIGGLGLLVRDGYDEVLTDTHLRKLDEMAPAVVVRRAMGACSASSAAGGARVSGGKSATSAVSYEVASIIRRTLRLRRRELGISGGGSARARPIA